MRIRLLARPTRRRGFAPVSAVLACAALLLAFAPAARADEAVTRSVQGVNYTLPSAWTMTEVPDGLLADTGLSDVVVFACEDGIFFAGAVYDDGLGDVDLEEMQQVADEAAAELAGIELLPGMRMSLSFSAAMEQGWPTLTVYTDDIELNGVVYGLTFKLFSVETSSFSGAVLMASFLPASGTVTEGFADSFPVLSQDTEVEVAGVSYVLPAGSTLAQGNVFGIDFFFAWQDEAAMLAVDAPLPGADAVGVDDLQLLADDLADFLQDGQPLLEELLPSVWTGAYEFLGCATLGFECLVDVDGLGTCYLAATMGMASEGIAFVAFCEPQGFGFAESVLVLSAEGSSGASASTDVSNATSAGQDGTASSTDPGFTVGFAA